MRILIAEDERITRASLARQLEALGHTVTAAEDGESAWAQFKPDAFDMVITDWEMPKVSGVELIRRIRQGPAGAYVYVAEEYAGLEILDVSDPAAPVRVGGYETSGYAGGVAVAGRYVYVADGDGGGAADRAGPDGVGPAHRRPAAGD